jgi:hypothetical protein
MAQNKFRWWTKGRPSKPLKANAPLLLKIRNGDFDYSYMFSEVQNLKETAQMAYETAYKNYGGTDEQNRIQAAVEARQRYRKRALKLEEEAHKNENKILWTLKAQLAEEFGKDLWEKSLERQRGKGTLEDLYSWYKKQVKQNITKSEMDMVYKRANTKGLEHLF